MENKINIVPINLATLPNLKLSQELTYKDVMFHLGCGKNKAQTTIRKVRKRFNTIQLRITLYQLLVFQGIISPLEVKI